MSVCDALAGLPRDPREAALDRAVREIETARRHLIALLTENLCSRPAEHGWIVALDRALADIATLRAQALRSAGGERRFGPEEHHDL